MGKIVFKRNHFKRICKFILLAVLCFLPQFLFADSFTKLDLELGEFVQEEVLQYQDKSDTPQYDKNVVVISAFPNYQTVATETAFFLQDSFEEIKVFALQARSPQFEASLTKIPREDSPSGKGVTRFSKDLVLSQSRDSRSYFLLPTITRESYQHSFIHFHTVQLFFWQEFVQAKFQRYLALLTNSPPFCNRIRHRRKPC